MDPISTVRMPSHRKLIDIPGNVFQGTIEDMLVREMEDMDDAEIYKYLVSTRPEGKVMLNAQEKEDFEKWLDAHRK